MAAYRTTRSFLITTAFLILGLNPLHAETIEYQLTLAQEEVNFTGTPVQGMTLNGGIPGPTLYFKEGDNARIHVRNRMSAASSIHWHGLLVPPDMDGVPYVSFPPIAPGETYTYEFPIRQSGTYWYHSHSSLQEQSGVYGAIVILPKDTDLQVDRDHVVLFSDWTDEDPHSVNRTLRRGSEWYALEKGSGQSIIGAARAGRLGAYFKRELQRMPAMDIADVAYDRFLANGQSETTLPATPNETVRLRIIDGSATTYFHLEFAGGPMTIISADGQDVEPFKERRFLIGVAETYDVLIQMPASGAYELRATAHDGSGIASVWLGSGKRHRAPDVPKPNLYDTMDHFNIKHLFSLTPAGAMGMSDEKVKAGRFDKPGMMMDMEHMGMDHTREMGDSGHKEMGHLDEAPKATMKETSPKEMDHGHGMADAPEKSMRNMEEKKPQDMGMSHRAPKPMRHDTEMPSMQGHADPPMKQTEAAPMAMDHAEENMSPKDTAAYNGRAYGKKFGWMAADIASAKELAADGMDPRRPWPPYEKLRAVKSTAPSKELTVRTIRLTLDGDMERYVWFLNNRPISEEDVIHIRSGEVVRFVMINRTMMHHPMHLHGHFFRVINGQGDRAPLKHTVDVAPMSTTVIEFEANEVGDWFFHCHLLYHMKNGMARIIHYQDYKSNRELVASRPKLVKDAWYFQGHADAMSHMTEGAMSLSDTRNTLMAEWEVGWQDVDDTEWEVTITWDRYINRFSSVFAGVDRFDEEEEDETRGVLGFRYLLPLNVESRFWVDSDGGARINLEKEFMLTPRWALGGEAQYDSHEAWEGAVHLSYLVSRRFSVIGQWNSEFGVGAGIQIRF